MNDSTVGKQSAPEKEFQVDPNLVITPQIPTLNPFFYKETISPSKEESSHDAISASSPHIDSSVAVMAVELSLSQICLNILSSWNDSLHQQQEVQKEQDKKTDLQKDVLQSAQAASDIKTADIHARENLSVKGVAGQEALITSVPINAAYNYFQVDAHYIGMEVLGAVMSKLSENTAKVSSTSSTTSVTPSEKSTDIGPEHFITAAMILGGALALTQAVPGTGATSGTEFKVIQDAWNAVVPQSQIPVLVAGTLSSMWGGALVLKMSAEGAAKYVRGEAAGPKHDLNFAKTYAETLAGSLKSPQYNEMMLVALNKAIELSPEAKNIDPNVLLAKGKMIMLALTLALVYKLEISSGLEVNGRRDEGHVSTMDVAGLLQGKIDLKSYDKGTASIIRMLTEEFHANSKLLVDRNDRAKTLESIFAYLDSNPSVEGLTDQQSIFNSLLGPKEVFNPAAFEG
jgi:hypothetical protein